MKKLLSLALAALMLAGALATPVLAADGDAAPVADPLDANLVVYYDFEGATPEEALKDKAPAGVSKEDLVLASTGLTTSENATNTTLSPNTRVENGKLYVDHDESDHAGCYFDKVSGTEDAVGADIFNNQTGEITFYSESQLMTMCSNWVCFMTISNVARCYYSGKNQEMYSPFNVRHTAVSGKNATMKDNMLFYGMQTLRMAATYKYDAEAKTLQCALMYTTDDGYTWITTENSYTDIAEFFTNATYLTLGKSQYSWEDRNGDIVIDNVRVYNKALSLDEVQTLAPFTPADKPVETTEEPTEAPTKEATKAPAKTDAPKNEATKAPATEAPKAEKKGCGSVVAAGLFGMMVLMGGACLTMRKKEN